MNFQSKFTKLFIAIALILSGVMAYAAATGNLSILPQKILGAIAVPFQSITSTISYKLEAIKENYLNIDEIVKENDELKNQIAEYRAKQVDYDKILIENNQYKEFLSIKEENPNFEVVSATVIGRDGLDKFYSFTIDKGENDGIEKNDVVMSSEGVVGLVLETGPNYSKVITILSPAVNIGSFISSSRDNGIVSGDSDLSNDLKCVMKYLPKDVTYQENDIVITTGIGTIFPKDLVIGTIEEINIDDSGNSKYAIINPATDISQVKFVFVITDF